MGGVKDELLGLRVSSRYMDAGRCGLYPDVPVLVLFADARLPPHIYMNNRTFV